MNNTQWQLFFFSARQLKTELKINKAKFTVYDEMIFYLQLAWELYHYAIYDPEIEKLAWDYSERGQALFKALHDN